MKEKEIQNRLSEQGYKLDFWYEDGKLDAICVAKWIGSDLEFQKKYSVGEIASLIFDNFIISQPKQ